MSINMNLHKCTGLRVASNSPSNGNALELVFTFNEGEHFELTLFNMPSDVTDKLLAAFADEDTRIPYKGGGYTMEGAIEQADFIIANSCLHNGMVKTWREQAINKTATIGMLKELKIHYLQLVDALEIVRLVENGEPVSAAAAGLGYTPGEAEDLFKLL